MKPKKPFPQEIQHLNPANLTQPVGSHFPQEMQPLNPTSSNQPGGFLVPREIQHWNPANLTQPGGFLAPQEIQPLNPTSLNQPSGLLVPQEMQPLNPTSSNQPGGLLVTQEMQPSNVVIQCQPDLNQLQLGTQKGDLETTISTQLNQTQFPNDIDSENLFTMFFNGDIQSEVETEPPSVSSNFQYNETDLEDANEDTDNGQYLSFGPSMEEEEEKVSKEENINQDNAWDEFYSRFCTEVFRITKYSHFNNLDQHYIGEKMFQFQITPS